MEEPEKERGKSDWGGRCKREKIVTGGGGRVKGTTERGKNNLAGGSEKEKGGAVEKHLLKRKKQ